LEGHLSYSICLAIFWSKQNRHKQSYGPIKLHIKTG